MLTPQSPPPTPGPMAWRTVIFAIDIIIVTTVFVFIVIMIIIITIVISCRLAKYYFLPMSQLPHKTKETQTVDSTVEHHASVRD